MVSYKSLQRKDLTRSYRPDPTVRSPHECAQSPVAELPLLSASLDESRRSVAVSVCSGRSVQRIALYYYYSRAAGNSAQTKSAHTFCQNLWFFRPVLTCNSRSVSFFNPMYHCYPPYRLGPRFHLFCKSLISKAFAPGRIFGRDKYFHIDGITRLVNRIAVKRHQVSLQQRGATWARPTAENHGGPRGSITRVIGQSKKGVIEEAVVVSTRGNHIQLDDARSKRIYVSHRVAGAAD